MSLPLFKRRKAVPRRSASSSSHWLRFRPPFRKRPLFEALEPRLLLSADFAPDLHGGISNEPSDLQSGPALAVDFQYPAEPLPVYSLRTTASADDGASEVVLFTDTVDASFEDIVGSFGRVLTISGQDEPLAITLLLSTVDGVETLEILASGGAGSTAILPRQPLLDITSIVVEGTPHDDYVMVDLGATAGLDAVSFVDFNGDDQDRLALIGGNTQWYITGVNSGHVNSSTPITFSGVEHLVGGPDNEDTFFFQPGGTLAGAVHGGDRGFDTLVIDDVSHTVAVYTASGPDSGTVRSTTRPSGTLVWSPSPIPG